MLSHIENSHRFTPFFPEKQPAADSLMARGSEPRQKVIKIPIRIEENNRSTARQASCQNWPPGGRPDEVSAAASSRWTASDLSGHRESGGAASASAITRIIPIRLPDGRLNSSGGHSPEIIAAAEVKGGGQGPIAPEKGRSAAAGVSGLRARLAGSRTNSVEESSAARAPSVKVEHVASHATGTGTSPLPPSSETAESLLKASSASASDIWYVRK